MIAFNCKQCRKRQTRPDSQAGTLVFCECGQGNRVPWSNPVEPVVVDAMPVDVPAAARPARPIPVAVPAETSVPASRQVDDRRPAASSLPSRRAARVTFKVNPNFCFQHDESAVEATCDACKLPFCMQCVVTLQGQTLCGPCKNFRIAALGRAPRVLPLAVVALVVSLVSGPVVLILSLVGIGRRIGEGETGEAVVLCLLAIVLPITGLFLAGRALRQIHARPEVSGVALAAGGMCAALVGALWCVTVITFLAVRRLID